jgi:hypothetical protein
LLEIDRIKMLQDMRRCLFQARGSPPRVCYFFFTAEDLKARTKRVRLFGLCPDIAMKPLPHADEIFWNRAC